MPLVYFLDATLVSMDFLDPASHLGIEVSSKLRTPFCSSLGHVLKPMIGYSIFLLFNEWLLNEV